ncbi:LysR family transcriptional regulator [Photobacterium galatheae]|uniref:LysR family transcriptional regulator n=1 Tax=Photobacterium galatheae TaxID=1654360 RepID=A0A066RRL9_9GAMM|nr:LysR family transcriptional regulator [Photobacterium galatheae]
MKLDSLQLFQHVVEQGGITQTADFLAMPKSSVSRKVKALEEQFNVQLISRSARYFTLTEAGEIFYEHSREILTQLKVLEQEMADHRQEIAGKISILCVSPLLKCFGEILRDFCRQYPDVELAFHAQEVVQRNIPKRRFDLLIQLDKPVTSNLIGKTIGQMYADYYASPEYLAEHGTPTDPETLINHRLIFRELSQDQPKQWWFQNPLRSVDLGSANITVVDSSDMALTLARQGFGVAILPDIQAMSALDTQELVSLFEQQHRHCLPVNLIYHNREHIPRRVRLLIDFLAKHFAEAAAKYQLQPESLADQQDVD